MTSRGVRWLAAAALAWALAAALAAFDRARSLPPDPAPTLEAAFVPLAAHLPPTGEIGYLEHHAAAATDAEVRRYFAAQYALVPRVIVSRTGPEYLIVAPGTADPARDARLEPYVLAAALPDGLRVYRRRP